MARLSDFEILSFDCYGTLIDWETGLVSALTPWLQDQGREPSREEILAAFARHEASAQAASPTAAYPEILTRVHRRLASELGIASEGSEAESFARSVRSWPPFPDSPQALAYLARHFRLAVLSNIDRESFRQTNRRLRVEFDWIFTAEEIGSYKPDPRNFRFMLDRLAEAGIEPSRVLHCAQSLYHDLVPAARLGLATCWIDRRGERRGWGATPPPAETPRIDFREPSLAALAQRHRDERG